MRKKLKEKQDCKKYAEFNSYQRTTKVNSFLQFHFIASKVHKNPVHSSFLSNQILAKSIKV